MKQRRLTYGLLLVLALCIGVVVAVQTVWTQTVPHPRAAEMRAAARQAASWFDLIAELKDSRGVEVDRTVSTPFPAMIGADYTPLTTTLGSLKAKVTSANPEFAAVITRLLIEAGIDSNSVVGVTQSASFPSLAVSSMAALQTLGCKAVVISSIGASTYGANQPECTWLDMEAWLRERGGLKYRSMLVTLGAGEDRGDGLTEEGLDEMSAAALRNGYEVYRPASLQESIEHKADLLRRAGIDLLINIGGNHASLGGCVHGATIPNGFHSRYAGCTDPNRGLISLTSERSVPYIHLLNIRDLAIRYGLELEAGRAVQEARYPYVLQEVRRAPTVAGLVLIWSSLGLLRWKMNNQARVERSND